MQLNKKTSYNLTYFFLVFIWSVLLLGLLSSADAALPFKKVSIAKTPASTTSTSTTTTTTTPEPVTEKEEPPTAEGEESKVSTSYHSHGLRSAINLL